MAYAEAVMVLGAMQLAWFFMLRAKEFGESNGIDEELITRGCDVHQREPRPSNGGDSLLPEDQE